MPTQSYDPRTGLAFGPVVDDTSPAELELLLDRAAAAAAGWADSDGAVRARLLRAIADALDADEAALVEIADLETGLGEVRLRGELARTSFQLRMFADVAAAGGRGREVDPEVAGPPPAGHPELVLARVPLGPVAVYGASNFPFAFSVPGGDVAAALAAGCPVVAKAHPAHPQTSQRCADLIASAVAAEGLPAGVFGLVHGFEAGQRLVVDPRVRAAAFTGSGAGGRALFDAANGRPDPIPFYGELGSVNPVVVTPAGAADPGSLVDGWLGSLTLGGGQFCTNPGLLLVPSGSGVVEEIARLAPDLPAPVLLHEGIGDHLDRNVAVVEAATGVHVLAEGLPPRGPGASRQVRIVQMPATTALAEPAAIGTECFGPVGVVVEYDGRDQLLDLVAVLPGCLVGTVHGSADEPLAAEVVQALARISGRVVWNGWPTGVAVTAGQHHGGPWPATTNPLHTSVGTAAVDRFTRPVAFQSVPPSLLPPVVTA